MALNVPSSVRMPVTQTRRFGALEYDPANVLTFPQGLPGFPGHSLFTLVEKPELSPVVCLQSLNTPDLCFLAAPMPLIDPEYSLALSSDDVQQLVSENESTEDLICLALLCAPENGPLTANLLAPVVIRPKTRIAVQSVRTDARYSHQHPLGAVPQC